MDKLFTRLQYLLKKLIAYPYVTITSALLIGTGGFLLASKLSINTDLAELIPRSYPSVQAIDRLREQVGAEHEVAVIIKSPSFEANKSFAEKLIPIALSMKRPNDEPYFLRAEFKKEVDFLKRNALYLATDKELDRLEDFLERKIEEAKNEANPFYIELDDPSEETDSIGQELQQMYDELVGSEYPVSKDSTALAVKLFPTGSQTDLSFVRATYSSLQSKIDSMDLTTYHPDMEVVLAGRLIRTLIEVQTITGDVTRSFGGGVLMLLIFVVSYFQYKSYRAQAGRYFSLPLVLRHFRQIPAQTLLLALPLALSLAVTFGIAWIAYETLTIMTATLGLLLFGMGIDFGIHFFARYAEERGAGNSVEKAIVTTFMTTGQAIAVVGITTSAAFFILTIADFKGFSEFGFIAGVGLLLAIIAYIFFLPALLVAFEKSAFLNLSDLPQKVVEHSEKNDQPPKGKWIPYGIIGFALLLTGLSLWELPKLQFEYHFGSLEPDYEEYIRLNREMNRVYSDRGSRNAAYIIVE